MLAVWPLAFALSVAGTVLASLVTAAVQNGHVGPIRDTVYVSLWVAFLAAGPAVVFGAPVLAVAATGVRGVDLGWQVLIVGGVAAGVAAGCTMVVHSPWGPFRWMSVDPAAPYPWGDVVLLTVIAAFTWGAGTGAAWAVVRPVRPATAARTTPAWPQPA